MLESPFLLAVFSYFFDIAIELKLDDLLYKFDIFDFKSPKSKVVNNPTQNVDRHNIPIFVSSFSHRQIEIYAMNSKFEALNLVKGFGHFCWILFGSCLIGSCCGFVNALITKFASLKTEPVIETAVFFLVSYSSFLLAEAFHLTGVVAVLICGLVQAHYTHKNLSIGSKRQTAEVTPLFPAN